MPKKVHDFSRIESGFSFRLARCSYRRLLHFPGCGQHLLRAIGETVHFATSRRPLIVPFESRINPPQDSLLRNARIFPCLDQRPIQRGKQQNAASPALKVLFNFGEVVEIVFHETQRDRGLFRGHGFEGLAATAAVRGGLTTGASRPAFAFRSQMMRRPSNVKKSSTCLMCLDPLPIRAAKPPVATIRVSSPISSSRRSRIPSTRPKYP